MRNYFEDLGLQVSAGAADVQRAYRRLAMELHPDRAQGEVNASTAAMARVNEARDVLMDDDRRAAHRRELERHWNTSRNGLGAVMTSEGWRMPGARDVKGDKR